MNNPSGETLKQAMKDIIRGFNIDIAAKAKPTHSLEQVLTINKLSDLRKMGRAFKIKYYSKKNKQALAKALADLLSDPDILMLLLDLIPNDSWKLFLLAVRQPDLVDEPVLPQDLLPLQKAGLLQAFYHLDKLWFIVPDAIKETFADIEQSDYIEERNRAILMTDICLAATNLYGVISQQDAVAIFNRFSTSEMALDDANDLLHSIPDHAEFRFWKQYVVASEFEEDDFKLVDELLADRAGKPRYEPPYDEFINYADWSYYEKTPQLKSLGAFLSKYEPDLDKRLDILDEVHDLCSAEARLQAFFDLIDARGITMDEASQPHALADLLVAVQNSTRLWRNHGHTPDETFQGSRNIRPFRTAVKMGRNDPCPCGSGKKYKRCCGK